MPVVCLWSVSGHGPPRLFNRPRRILRSFGRSPPSGRRGRGRVSTGGPDVDVPGTQVGSLDGAGSRGDGPWRGTAGTCPV